MLLKQNGVKIMKKLIILLLINLSIFVPQLFSISVTEYIQQHGMPQVKSGILDFSGIGLTSLEGLQEISTEVLKQVSELNLSRNHLQVLPANILEGFHNLEYLRITFNCLQTLPTNIFSGLNNLVYINLSFNKLQELPNNVFNNLHNLTQLYLSNNQIQTLSVNSFSGLHNLKTLCLGCNKLQMLPVGIFNGLHNLEMLNLTINPFRVDFLLNLPSLIRGIPSLKYLDCEPVGEALKSYRVYNPKTLQEITKEYTMQNLTSEQLEELVEANDPAFDLLPLSKDKKKAIFNKIEEKKKAQFMVQVLVESLGQVSSSISK